MVNFLSIFCPELQKLLKPIYDLTRKGRPFIWGEEQQESFEEIKISMCSSTTYAQQTGLISFIF